MGWYALHRQHDGNLWELFQEEFVSFDAITWKRVDRNIVYALRAFLRCGGVYVKHNGRNLTIAQSLVNVIQEETQSEWEIADINQKGGVRTDLLKGPITSVYITIGNRTLAPPQPPLIEAPPVIEPPAIELPVIEAPVIEPPVIELPVIEAPVIELPVIEAPAIELPQIEAPVIEALLMNSTIDVIEAPQTEALLIKASPVDTILVKTDEHAFTSIIDYYFAGSSIPESLSTTTLTLPLFSTPATELGHSYSL